MNRKELNAALVAKTGMYHKDVDKVLSAVIEEIQTQLAQGESVKLQGLGTFEVRPRAPRKGRNLNSGEEIFVPAQLVPGFKASQQLKSLVDG